MGNQYKVCVYAICKNEEKFIDRWVDSAKEADIIVVTDTGSSDGSVQKLKAAGVHVYTLEMELFRFDYARNESLKHVPEDVDICIPLDFDDVIEPGWRKCLEDAWTPKTKRGLYLYNWSFNTDGTPAVQYIHQRIHSRHGYRWVYPVHEVIEYTGAETEVQTFIPGLVQNNHSDTSKSRHFYLSLLELAVKENPDSSRNLHYLGREYMFNNRWDECIEVLEKYLSLSTSTWSEERAASMRFISRALYAKKETAEAKKWLYKAIAENPMLREPYVELAKISYDEKNWPATYFFSNEAIKIEHKSLGYANEEFAWNWFPYDLAALACYNLGMYKEALRFSGFALKMLPDNERLLNNDKYYREAVADLKD